MYVAVKWMPKNDDYPPTLRPEIRADADNCLLTRPQTASNLLPPSSWPHTPAQDQTTSNTYVIVKRFQRATLSIT